jgi:glucokinase
MATGIGIDVGGTKILGVRLIDGEVDHVSKCNTPSTGGPGAVIEAIVETAQQLLVPEATAIGIGAPGPVVPGSGQMGPATNLTGWDRPIDIAGPLGSELGLPVVVENDTNAAAAAEHRTGAGQGSTDMLALWLGTGVGGGLVLDGQLRRGKGLAGEIGHVVVQPGGRRCGCGGVGHLEAYAGRAAIEREARRRHDSGEKTLLVELAGTRRMKSSLFVEALERGDEIAGELLGEAVGAVGAAVADIELVLDLDRVVLGGGVANRLGPYFVDGIRRTAGRGFGHIDLEVVLAELGDHAGAVGAAVLALDTARGA